MVQYGAAFDLLFMQIFVILSRNPHLFSPSDKTACMLYHSLDWCEMGRCSGIYHHVVYNLVCKNITRIKHVAIYKARSICPNSLNYFRFTKASHVPDHKKLKHNYQLITLIYRMHHSHTSSTNLSEIMRIWCFHQWKSFFFWIQTVIYTRQVISTRFAFTWFAIA